MTFPGLAAMGGAGAAAHAIPGVGQVLGGIELLGGLAGLFGGHKRRTPADKMSAEQLKMLKLMEPLMKAEIGPTMSLIDPLLSNAKKADEYASHYDPAKQTEDLTRSYDMAARQSVGADLGNVTANSAAKGWTLGTGDSSTGGQVQDVLARRASDRAGFISNLKANEPTNYMNVTGAGADRLRTAFGALDPSGRSSAWAGAMQGPIQNAQYSQARSDSFDPTNFIKMIGSGFGGLTKRRIA